MPPLTPDKANQYAALFEDSGAQNGLLAGEFCPRTNNLYKRGGFPSRLIYGALRWYC